MKIACIGAAALLAVALGLSTAEASTVKCQRTIAKAGAQFLQAKAKALGACEQRRIAGGGACPDATATTAIGKATAKLTAAIGKSCGGDDRVCGGDRTNEDLPATLDWPATCPEFERASCNVTIDTCADIADCLVCLGTAAVEQAIDLYYGDLVLPSTGALNACQRAIGKATTTFLAAKSKALQKCWDAKLNGKLAPGATCIDPDPGDGKYQAAIQKAELKKKTAICRACGGPDADCDGTNDLDPAAIGFSAACPAVTVPGGTACGGPITDLTSLVACVDCVTEFKVACVDRAQVPQNAPYPSECNVCLEPPPSGPCPTGVSYTLDGPNADFDLGFNGLAHDAPAPSNTRLTLAVGGCAGVAQPGCGECAVSGPLSGGSPPFDTRRCHDQTWVSCATDLECTNAGASGPCVDFFGPPQPKAGGGVGVCVLNEIAGPVSGTVNVDDGTSATTVTVVATTFVTGPTEHPCPTCDRHCAGGDNFGLPCSGDDGCPSSTCSSVAICSDGARQNLSCSPQGTGIFGNVSLDCPPNPSPFAGPKQLLLNLGTGTQSRTVTAANPFCRQTGYTSQRCLCDTCNNATQDICSTNADCSPSGGAPGICGGRRCLGGSEAGKPCSVCLGGANHGATCSNSTACPGGTCSVGCAGGGSCNRPGEPTQTTDCATEMGCVDVGNDEGECVDGPVSLVCSREPFRACANDLDCNPPPSGSCDGCAEGQTCITKARDCFPGSDVLGGSVSVHGSAQVPCAGSAKPTIGALFCVAPVASSFINVIEGGLPGLGRIRAPAVMQLLP